MDAVTGVEFAHVAESIVGGVVLVSGGEGGGDDIAAWADDEGCVAGKEFGERLANVLQESWSMTRGTARGEYRTAVRGIGGVSGASSSSTMSLSSHDRKTFFRVLAVAALTNILSRSLRRKSFVRIASALLLLQFICVSLWWGALSDILSVEVFDDDEVIAKFAHASGCC